MRIYSKASATTAPLSGATWQGQRGVEWDAMQSKGFTDVARATLTSNTTLTQAHCGLLLVSCASGNVTLTLPASGTAADENQYDIIRTDTSANTLTITRAGSDTIEGANSILLPILSRTRIVLPAGATVWRRMSQRVPTWNYLEGFAVSATSGSTSFTIAPGECMDSTNAAVIDRIASGTKTTAAFAEGSGNGGLDIGSMAANTYYYPFALRRPDTGVTDVCFSLSATAPTLSAPAIAAFTQYRRIPGLLYTGATASQLINAINLSNSSVALSAAVNTTSGTAIDIVAIPTDKQRFTLYFNDVSTNSAANWLVQLGDSGGIETTTYTSISQTLDGVTSPNAQVASTSGMIIGSGTAANVLRGSLAFSLIDALTNTWQCAGQLAVSTAVFYITGQKSLSAPLDRVRLTTVGGTATFDSGKLSISWE
jgi:hypothetical protein